MGEWIINLKPGKDILLFNSKGGKKKTHNYICQVKITKKLILHFIRELNEVRKYNTNVDMSSAIQVNVSSHYATVANGGKVTIGSIASQDTW